MKIKKRLQAAKLLTIPVNDRIMMLFAAVHLSAIGTKRTFPCRRSIEVTTAYPIPKYTDV